MPPTAWVCGCSPGRSPSARAAHVPLKPQTINWRPLFQEVVLGLGEPWCSTGLERPRQPDLQPSAEDAGDSAVTSSNCTCSAGDESRAGWVPPDPNRDQLPSFSNCPDPCPGCRGLWTFQRPVLRAQAQADPEPRESGATGSLTPRAKAWRVPGPGSGSQGPSGHPHGHGGLSSGSADGTWHSTDEPGHPTDSGRQRNEPPEPCSGLGDTSPAQRSWLRLGLRTCRRRSLGQAGSRPSLSSSPLQTGPCAPGGQGQCLAWGRGVGPACFQVGGSRVPTE